MEFSGLITRFPVQRPLSASDYTYQLKQSKRLAIEPKYQLSVIKMNATFLETVDKWFAWKGALTALALTIILIFTLPLALIAGHSFMAAAGQVETRETPAFLVGVGCAVLALLLVVWWLMAKLLKKECFAYTHYPLRFNRKTRTVHWFRTDGSTASAAWDKLFFTLVPVAGEWDVRGHVLADDGATVIDTFALSYTGVILREDLDPQAAPSQRDFVRAHWEFVRRYMEEGPRAVSQPIEFCMPVDGRKESVKGGAQRVFANFAGGSSLFMALVAPICAWIILGRMLAVKTSRIPQWPREIEDACRIEPGDPAAFTGDTNGNRIAVTP